MKKIPAVAFLVLTACSSIIYVPNSHNVPAFSSSKEFQGNVSVQVLNPLLAGLQAQSAYSFTNHIGAIANYSYSRNILQTGINGQGHLGELGIGYYTNNPKQNHFGIFLGYGISSFNASGYEYQYMQYYHSSPPPGLSRESASRALSDYRNLFLMPSYAFRNERLTIIASIKINHIDFENIYSRDNINFLSESKPDSYHFEPAVTFKFGLRSRSFGFIGQVGQHFTNDTSLQDYSNFLFRVSGGFQWTLAREKE
jgi:hypothetical protein